MIVTRIIPITLVGELSDWDCHWILTPYSRFIAIYADLRVLDTSEQETLFIFMNAIECITHITVGLVVSLSIDTVYNVSPPSPFIHQYNLLSVLDSIRISFESFSSSSLTVMSTHPVDSSFSFSRMEYWISMVGERIQWITCKHQLERPLKFMLP